MKNENKCRCGGKMEGAVLSKMFNISGEFGSRIISVTGIPGKECTKCHREVMSIDTEIKVGKFVKRGNPGLANTVEFPG